MLAKEPSPARAGLGFKDAVLSSFRFLNDAGFRTVEQQITFVRYESSDVFVNVYHGRSSFELGVEIGRQEEPSKKLTLDDIVAWAGAEGIEGFGQHVMFQVSSHKSVQEFVPKIARLVQQYAAPLLRGDRFAFDSAFDLQSSRATELAKEFNLKGVREKAETAWHAKDYAQVIDLYSAMRDDLTEVEAKRLAYAEQQAMTTEGAAPRSKPRRHRA